MMKRTKPVLAALLVLAACGEADDRTLRPNSQPLDRLLSVESPIGDMTLTETERTQVAGICGEILRISEEGGLIRDRSDPARMVVDETLWSRVPAHAQRELVRCAELALGEGEHQGSVTVVEAP
jgi:hypothetical protein